MKLLSPRLPQSKNNVSGVKDLEATTIPEVQRANLASVEESRDPTCVQF